MTYDDLLKWRIISIISLIFLAASIILVVAGNDNVTRTVKMEHLEVPHIPSYENTVTYFTSAAVEEIMHFKKQNSYAREVYVSYADFLTNTVTDVFILSDYEVGFDRYASRTMITTDADTNKHYFNVLGGKIECRDGVRDMSACTISIPPKSATNKDFGGFLTIMFDDTSKTKKVKEDLFNLSTLIDRGYRYDH